MPRLVIDSTFEPSFLFVCFCYENLIFTFESQYCGKNVGSGADLIVFESLPHFLKASS